MTRRNQAQLAVLIWAAAIVFGLLDIFLFFWTPSGNDYKSPWAVPVVSSFFLMMIMALLSMRMDQDLLRKITGDSPIGGNEPSPVQKLDREEEPPLQAPPIPPFAVQMLSADTVPPISQHAAALVTRARGLFADSALIFRNGIWILAGGYVAIGFLGWTLGRTSPLVEHLSVWFLSLVIAFAFNPRKHRLTAVYVFLAIINLAWLVLIIYIVGAYILDLTGFEKGGELDVRSGLPVLLGLAVLIAYVAIVTGKSREFQRRALANPPLKLLFLRVFSASEDRVSSLLLGLGATWRVIGSLQLLQGGNFLSYGNDLFTYLKDRDLDIIADTPEKVMARIKAFKYEPSAWMCMYHTNTLLCHDRTWRLALDILLNTTDLVLIDLSEFSKDNRGVMYEIGQLIDRISTTRFVLLINKATDREFLLSTLQDAWQAMAVNSPNRLGANGCIRIFQLRQEFNQKGELVESAVEEDADRIIEILFDGTVQGQPQPSSH